MQARFFLILLGFILIFSGCTQDEDTADTTAPVFISLATVSVNENQVAALTLKATDENRVTYAISGTDSASFNVDSTTGVVIFKTAPDYETKTAYAFTAKATDEAGNEVIQNITLNIIDINEKVSLHSISLTAGQLVLDVNETTTLVAIAHYSNNTTENISSKVEWIVANSAVARVDTNGTLKALKEGTTSIKVKKSGLESNVVNIEVIVSNVIIDKLIKETRAVLNDTTIAHTTEADFNTTEYAKHHLPYNEARKLERAHMLVATATDPDPDWFSTNVDKQVIVAQAGQDYVVHLNKEDKSGTIIGAVDNDKLRIIVRIQRAKNDFEYVTNNDIKNYASWTAQGVLKIHVPNDLDKGRLLVSIRPAFNNVATSAIAERWSTVIIAEVWQTKSSATTLQASEVLFPIKNSSNTILNNSKFSNDEIGAKVREQLENNSTLMLPLVTQNTQFKKGDLISYMIDTEPYSGRVFSVQTRDKQQLVLLTPEYFEVYDIMDANDGFMIEEGLSPQHIIYREGDVLPTDVNESDPLEFKKRTLRKETRGKVSDFFVEHCTQGSSVVTWKPSFSFSPLDAGLDVAVYASTDKTECVWKATSNRVVLKNLILATGGPLAIVAKLFGSGGDMQSFGDIKISVNHAPGFGLEVGYSLSKGSNFKVVAVMNTVAGLGSRDIFSALKAAKASAEVSSTMGLQLELNAISSDGIIGYALAFLKIDISTIGIQSTSGISAALVAEAKNAREVYDTKISSQLAAKISATVDVTPTKTFNSFFQFLGLSTLASLSIDKELMAFKAPAEHTFTSVTDDGQGSAHLNGLQLTRPYLKTILPSSLGVMSPLSDISSVFNDHGETISYDLDECAQDSNYEILSPAIGCSGWMCGVVIQPVKLCKGKLSISNVVASARIREMASGIANIVNKAGDVTVEVSGSPLKPATTSLTMPNNTEQTVAFSKRCPSSPGVFRGTATVSAVGTPFQDVADNIMICHDDDLRGDPHLVTADGLGYDYYASGDYILSRIDGVLGYEIQARFLPGYETSWPQALSLRVGSDVVEIQGTSPGGHGGGTGVFINALSVWINGERSFLGTSKHWGDTNNVAKVITLPSGGMLAVTRTASSNVLTYPTSITVIWPKDSQTESYGVILNVAQSGDPFVQIQIARPNTFAGKEQGLMGNNDGDPNNDFIRRNGQVLGVDDNLSFTELYGLFGTDWLARPYESLFRNPDAVKPEFPTGIITLTPEQRALGEASCGALTGFYKEACIIDVGLTGSADIVKEYYANTDDLNALSDVIVTPNVDRARYTMQVDSPVQETDSNYLLHYKQAVRVTHEAGEGSFMLLVRSPKGATALLGTGETSHTGEENFTTTLTVECTKLNATNNVEFLDAVGALQLWIQDPLSGTATHMVSEVALPCTDESKMPRYGMQTGPKIEFSDSNNTHQHYTQTLQIKHESNDTGAFILRITPPRGATAKLQTGEQRFSATGDYNTTVELDCTEFNAETNSTAFKKTGSVELWEKHPLHGTEGTLYESIGLSCSKVINVLKTGQIISYVDFDDGYYQTGEPRSYSRDDAKEVVLDRTTDLMWQDSGAVTQAKLWQDAMDYCEALDFADFVDWRLPAIQELQTIVDYGKATSVIDSTFQNMLSNDYWSSTTPAYTSGYTGAACYVDFKSGYSGCYNKTYFNGVRCVRGGQ